MTRRGDQGAAWRGRFSVSGVRARVTLIVLAVGACLYSLLATAGFLLLAETGRDTIEARVGEVLDELVLRLQAGESAVRLSTADGVVAYVADGRATLDPPVSGVVQVVRPAVLDGVAVQLVGQSTDRRWVGDLRTVHRLTWAGVATASLVTALLAGAATGRALSPVRRTIDVLEGIDPDDTAARVPMVATGDELERLGGTVNGLLERIAVGRETQRRFTSDAAHELRTPLMALTGELELADVPGGVLDPAVVARLRRLAGRLTDRVDDLVLLSVLDEVPPLVTAPWDLRALVEREVASLDVADVPVVEVHGPAVVVEADEALVARAVRNLLTNARRHAARRVVVTVTDDHSAAVLHVDDDGPGITPERRHLVFDRFTRLDDSRSADRGGSGLGLAIVASVAARHGGWVDATDAPIGGARLTLALPAPTADRSFAGRLSGHRQRR